jgi:hypothetical protein
MRILACHPGPHFSVHDVYVGWVEAFQELGIQTAEYNLGDRLTFYDSAMVEISEYPSDNNFDALVVDVGDGKRLTFKKALTREQSHELAINGLYSALYRLKPDILFLVSAFFIPLELLDLARSYGTKVVILNTESPYEDDRQATYARHADFVVLNDPINLERFQEVTRAMYIPHGYRPKVHHLGEPVAVVASDFAFVGTGYPSRIEFMEAMDFGDLDVLLAGNWQQLDEDSALLKYVAHEVDECLDNTQTADVYRSAKIGMNLYRKEAESPDLSQGVAMGPREVEMASCGMFFLRDRRTEGDGVLSMLPVFACPKEATEQLHWWMDRPVQRRDLALQARLAVKDRTFTNHAKILLGALEV